MSAAILRSRCIRSEASNHQLGTLLIYAELPVTGRDHRAHADAEMAVYLTLYPERGLMERFERRGDLWSSGAASANGNGQTRGVHGAL